MARVVTRNAWVERQNPDQPIDCLCGYRGNGAPLTESLADCQAQPDLLDYPYAPSMIIVQSDWSIPLAHKHGTLVVATDTPSAQLPGMFIRGGVLKVFGEKGELLAKADESFCSAFPGRKLDGVWARTTEPIATDDHQSFLEAIRAAHPPALLAHPNHVVEGWLQIMGVLFPDDVGWKCKGDGWVFLCCVHEKRPPISRPHFLKQQSKQKPSKSNRKGDRR